MRWWNEISLLDKDDLYKYASYQIIW
jgi:hypothetical protein